MKKEYIKPEMDVMEITVESMIATSPGTITGGDDDEGGSSEGGKIPLANDRRGGWGDLWN